MANELSIVQIENTQRCKRPVRCNLQRLRLSAGYRTAKEFAAAVGIPASTYNRYERAFDDSDISIPLKSAWAIADALGSTIDAVVGRTGIDEPSGYRLQAAYESLSGERRKSLDSYLRFLLSEQVAEKGI